MGGCWEAWEMLPGHLRADAMRLQPLLPVGDLKFCCGPIETGGAERGYGERRARKAAASTASMSLMAVGPGRASSTGSSGVCAMP